MRPRNVVLSFIIGLVFALGLGLAGMTVPQKIVGFLDFGGHWDPTLMFVMGGATMVYGVAFRLIRRRERPLFADVLAVPTRRDIDARLIAGAAIFGVGWGLGGFCPGPGLVGSVGLSSQALLFIGGMTGGVVLYRVWDRAVNRVGARATSATASNG